MSIISLQDFFNLTSPVCRMTVVPDQDVYTTQTIRFVTTVWSFASIRHVTVLTYINSVDFFNRRKESPLS